MAANLNSTAYDEAAAWFARLEEQTASEDTWLAFIAWLENSSENRAAYEAIEAAWVEADPMDPPSILLPLRRERPRTARGWWAAGIGAIAAAAVLALWTTSTTPSRAIQTFHTEVAQSKTATLGDGSTLSINGATNASVALSDDRRDVELAEGEISFDVAPDKTRPFYVSAGPRVIRVTGTEFNVLRHAARVTVTVRRGSVAVDSADGISLAVLSPGQQISVADGASATTVTVVDANDAFAWKEGRLVYRSASLDKVADDLGRYLGRSVRAAPGTEGIKVSGVLQVDTEDAMLRRLMLFAPVTAKVSAAEIVLYPR